MLRDVGIAFLLAASLAACGREQSATAPPPADARPGSPSAKSAESAAPSRAAASAAEAAARLGWKSLGAVRFPSKVAIACDPSYVADPKLTVRVPLDREDWEAWYVVDADDGSTIAQLALVRPGARPDGARGDAFGGALETVGVDSGQAGFFDPAHAGKDDEAVAPFADLGTKKPLGRWYLMCCARTLEKPYAAVVPFGVVSSSGYGDGGYEVFVRRDAAKAIEVVRVVFVDEEDDETK